MRKQLYLAPRLDCLAQDPFSLGLKRGVGEGQTRQVETERFPPSTLTVKGSNLL